METVSLQRRQRPSQFLGEIVGPEPDDRRDLRERPQGCEQRQMLELDRRTGVDVRFDRRLRRAGRLYPALQLLGGGGQVRRE